jgi:hypothetical protein
VHLEIERQAAEFDLAGRVGGWDQNSEMARHRMVLTTRLSIADGLRSENGHTAQS